MQYKSFEKKIHLRGSFASLGLPSLVGARECVDAAGRCATMADDPAEWPFSSTPSGSYELAMTVTSSAARYRVSAFEMTAVWERDGLTEETVATFIDLALPVGLSQGSLMSRGTSARASVTPFEPVGTEAVAGVPAHFDVELGSLGGAVSVLWPGGDAGHLSHYNDQSLGISVQIDGQAQLEVLVLPGGYDVDLDLHGGRTLDPGLLALLGCSLGFLALFTRRQA
jgi:hypothetical protein